MARKVHPTLSTFQERVIVGKCHYDGEDIAKFVKEAIGEKIVRMSAHQISLYQQHYDTLTDDQKSNPSK